MRVSLWLPISICNLSCDCYCSESLLNVLQTVWSLWWFHPSWFIDCCDQSHYQDPDLSLAVKKSSHLVLAAAVGVKPVNRRRCHFKNLIHKPSNYHISGIRQWISINEESKCAKICCSSFYNLYFPLEDVNIEIWVRKATVRKLLLSSIEDIESQHKTRNRCMKVLQRHF